MFKAILSDDTPRSPILTVALLVILVTLALTPFLFGGAQAINTAAKICVFIVLVASYDLLLGYTGIVSFAHTMFFGIGAYGVGLALYGWGPNWPAIGGGLIIALVVGVMLALVIGFGIAARSCDLLCHDHAGGRVSLCDPGRPAVVIHRRRGWPLVSHAGAAAADDAHSRSAHLRHRDHRTRRRLLSRLRRSTRAVSCRAPRS